MLAMSRLYVLLTLALLCVACTNEYYTEEIDPMGRLDQRKTGWSATGDLFTRVAGSISCQADFKNDQGEPQAGYFTIQFGIIPPAAVPAPNAADSGVYRALAIIRWSVEGGTVERVIDVANGTSISGCGQAVKVAVVDATLPANQNGPTTSNNKYTVSIDISPGTRPTTAFPPLLQILLPQAAGGPPQPTTNVVVGAPITVALPSDPRVSIPTSNGPIAVNPGATSLIPMFAPAVAGNAPTSIQLGQGQPALGVSAINQLNTGQNVLPVPLFPEATQVIISAQGPAGATAIVSLFLGIDG